MIPLEKKIICLNLDNEITSLNKNNNSIKGST
jgi:hypothetical protein